MSTEPGDDTLLTIDQLAHASGVTVRNVRSYQARGLLPPPTVRARTGYYNPDHLARLELIKELQGEGVKLDTIKRLLDTTGGSTEQVLGFVRRIRELFGAQPPQIAGVGELTERFGAGNPALLKRAERLGFLRRIDDDQYEEINPRLVGIGQELAELGIPAERSMEVAESLRRHADAIAKTFVQLFLDEIWKPFEESGRPDDQWPRLHSTMEQLRALSGDGLLAILDVAIGERLDVTFGRDIARTVRVPHDRAESGDRAADA
jgi:DNA-binding transcriptional MerR regulator